MITSQLYAEFFRIMSEIANDEILMTKVVKYAKKLAEQKKMPPDPNSSSSRKNT